MGRKIIVFSVIAALAAGFLVILPFALNASFQRPCFVFLDDPVLSLVFPHEMYEEFEKKISESGFRFDRITLESGFFDNENWKEKLDAMLTNVSVVMASPLITATLESEDFRFDERLPEIKSFGVSSAEKSCFDMMFLSDSYGGWLEAEKALDPDFRIAFLYSDDGFAETAHKISENHGAGSVLEKKVESPSVLAAADTVNGFEELDIKVVLCPYVQFLDYYFRKESRLMWIVDYRLALNVPKKNLYGIVYPDFVNSVLPFLSIDRNVLRLMSGKLVYGFDSK